MTSRNDVSCGESVSMAQVLGPTVPNCKATLSQDKAEGWGHLVPMTSELEKIAESQWRDGFRERIRLAQGKRTQEQMAKLLGISREAYSKYVGSRKSVMPTRYLSRFAAICAVDLDWLIDGDAAAVPQHKEAPPETRRKRA